MASYEQQIPTETLIAEIGTALPADLMAAGWRTADGVGDLHVGQVVYGYSRGATRRVVVAKLGRKNATVEYVTQGGLDEATRYGLKEPAVTSKAIAADALLIAPVPTADEVVEEITATQTASSVHASAPTTSVDYVAAEEALDARVAELAEPKTETFTTREAWLLAAVEAVAPIFTEQGVDLPAIHVSVGWPGGRGKKNAVIGQCWKRSQSADDINHLFISPVLGDAARVIDVLMHELVHAVDDCESGHRGAFARIAKSVGLEGKMTATTASPALAAKLQAIVGELGEYPHAVLAGQGGGADSPKKQGTRMIKLEDVDCGCGYSVRTTQKWIDEGMPHCPHGVPMAVA